MSGVVRPEELRLGDVLLVSGRGVFSRLVHLIEGTSFDHCLMVAPPDLEHPRYGRGTVDDRTDEVWAFDIGFFGGRHRPMSCYDDIVGEIGVRRHRLASEEPEILQRCVEIVRATKGYSWDRLLFLSLISATRWSASLTDLGPEQCSALVRALYEVLAQMHKSQVRPIEGERRICTDLLLQSHDIILERGHEYPFHAGIHVPPLAHEGLLWWATGMDSFADFLSAQPPPKRRGVLDDDLALQPGSEESLRLVHEVATTNGVSFPGFVPVDDATLRSIVIDGVHRSLGDLVAQPWRGDVRSASDPRRLAWFLLDTLMRHRFVVTPADIARTSTLIDVGFLDTAGLAWRSGSE